VYSLIIFDWDGTLMDSEIYIVASMQSAMQEQGLPVLTAAAVRDIIGLGLSEAVKILYPNEPDNRRAGICEAYSRHFVAGDTAALELFPDAEDVLRDLKTAGYRLAIATGKTRKGLDRLLAYNGWHGYFHGTRCADETQSKPHPQMLHELLEEFDCSAEQALMVGDTEFDLEMASNAGIDSVAVSYGVHEVSRLEAHAPRLIIDQLLELRDWLIVEGKAVTAIK
jgi:phosphoglycolate phosphatase